ncbi:phage tail protein [Chromobacterium haemolyticum]|uniref:Phage tail protein n=1 Tax=Chromobacterium fluminis TaxID=3044269 RepID=A0ABX0LFK5_9NEIS|nr:phage tail sheath subtilisin-like domain-containing protein [Chromobacterium haemolyticum]NHR08008.1 phage tail protein [Chromobacterium haemolyticum]
MISFNQIPQNQRVPLFFAEMDNSAANLFSQNQRNLLIGHKLSAGGALLGVAAMVNSVAQAWEMYGRGSMLASMVEATLANDPSAEVWAVPVEEPAGAAATATVTLSGVAQAAGVICLYVAGQRVQAVAGMNDSAAVVAGALAAAINAAPGLPVTAEVSGAAVKLACRWKGAGGNDIPLSLNYRGTLGGEALPPGVAVELAAFAGGAGLPSLVGAVLAMGDEEYDFIASGFSDTGALDLLKIEMADNGGRWSYSRQLYGHVYAALRGTVSMLQVFGKSRNDQHATVAGFEADVQAPAWSYAAAYAARNGAFLKLDPARPTQTGELVGILPARPGRRFVASERNVLLQYGIATSSTGPDGTVRVERAVTTFQKNAYGQPDVSYLDSETLFTSAYVLRRLRQLVTSKYGRHKLARDGTRFGAGQAIVTPNMIRAELVAEYIKMEALGVVENTDAFAEALIVEINALNPNRLDVLFPPDYVNQLRVFAVLNQFRLQY